MSAAGGLVEQSRDEVGELIASTVARWDPAESSARIELQVGRDLQFIRINGTVVGGLAGLVIHLVGAHRCGRWFSGLMARTSGPGAGERRRTASR